MAKKDIHSELKARIAEIGAELERLPPGEEYFCKLKELGRLRNALVDSELNGTRIDQHQLIARTRGQKTGLQDETS